MGLFYFTAYMLSCFVCVLCEYSSSILSYMEDSSEMRVKSALQLNSSKYSDVVESTAFVDKSFLLKKMLRDDRRVLLVTAPFHFGKSTNLNMIKSFYSIPVDSNGRLTDKNSTEMYKIFSNLIIHNYTRFFNAHFGSVPVMYLDLDASRRIFTYKEAFTILVERIHLCYVEHKYLINSVKLRKSERDICRVWCHKTSYKRLNNKQVKEGLINLATYLHTYYGKGVMLLIDEYDSMIMRYMSTVSKTDLRKITNLITDHISVVCETTRHVRIAVITGVSYIAGGGFSNLTNIGYYRFLETHKLNYFYGFLDDEANKLFSIPELFLFIEQMKEARLWYSGYTCRTYLNIMNPYSLLNFLKEGTIKNYWAQYGNVDDIRTFFKHQSILNLTQELLSFDYCPVEIYKNFTVEDILELQDLYNEEEVTVNREVFLSYLLETGYITFSGHQPFSHEPHLKVTNLEIVDFLFQEFVAAYRDRDPGRLPIVLSEIQAKARINMDTSKFLKFIRKYYVHIRDDVRKQSGYSDVYNVYIKYNITLF